MSEKFEWEEVPETNTNKFTSGSYQLVFAENLDDHHKFTEITPKEFKVQYALGLVEKSTREHISEWPNAPKELLIALSEDKDKDVRRNVAGNSNTPKEILEILSKDEEWSVRYGVASNTSTPKKILETLSRDDNPDVRMPAYKNLGGIENVRKI